MTTRLHASFCKHIAVAVRGERGVVSLMAALLMMALVGTLALAVDVGYAFGQRRLAQNVADSSAAAAAQVVSQNLLQPGSFTDANVDRAIQDVARQSSGAFASYSGTYVDSSLNAVGTVGSGSIPSGARGVRVQPTKQFPSLFANALGFTTLNARASAAAVVRTVTGYPGPYAVWGGEQAHRCSDGSYGCIPWYNGTQITGVNAGSGPYRKLVPSCWAAQPASSCQRTQVIYRSNTYQRDNVFDGDSNPATPQPNWTVNSNDFKGFLHDSNGYVPEICVGTTIQIDNQTGNAEGSQVLDWLENCYLSNGSCRLVLPIIYEAHSQGGSTSKIDMKVKAFVALKLLNNPKTAAPSQPWIGEMWPTTLTYVPGVTVTCTTQVGGVSLLQTVRLAS